MTALARREDAAPTANGNGALLDLDLDDVARSIEQLVTDADETTLREIHRHMEAHALYQERAGYLTQSNRFARAKLLTEQGLARLLLAYKDGSMPPRCPDSRANSVREWWTLAILHERRMMMPICDEIDAAGQIITTNAVARLASSRGWTRVAGNEVLEAVKDFCAREGMSRGTLAATALGSRSDLYSLGTSISWRVAVAIAQTIGVDPTEWSPAPRLPRTRQRRTPLWLKRERKRTGSQWDKAYGYFRQCVDQFKDLAPNNDPYWQEAYRHLKEIEDIIGFQMDKERAQKRTKQ